MAPRGRFLLVYDADEKWFLDRLDYTTAQVKISITRGTFQLAKEFDQLVAKGETFSRALFFSHGASGLMKFNGASVTHHSINDIFEPNKGYENLFPEYSRIYFDGCNVAAGHEGWSFLKGMGAVFLRRSGGITSGFIGKGVGLLSLGIFHTPIPLLNPTEGERKVFFGPGGDEVAREDEIGTRLLPIKFGPLERGTLKTPVQPINYDGVLMPHLERHVRYDTTKASEERLKKLQNFFGQMEPPDARALLVKLELHRSTPIYRAFHHNLPSAHKMKLLNILKSRAKSV